MKCICLIKGHKLEASEPEGLKYKVFCSRCGHVEERLIVGKASMKKPEEKTDFNEFLKKLWSKKND